MKKIAAFSVLIAAFVLGATSASAAVVTIGSPLTATFSPGGFNNGPITLINTATNEPGAQLTSPVRGRIIRWRVLQSEGGPFYLRVMRPSGPNYVGVGTSAPGVIASTALLTFPTSLPIQAGDTIGLEARGPSSSEAGFTPVIAGLAASYWIPALGEGVASPAPTGTLSQIAAFNADVQPAPSVAAIAPATGPTGGGTAVTITGTDFTDVSAVNFGGTPATSYVVDSASRIIATAPAVAAPGEVDVSVVALGGTSLSAATDRFKYEAAAPKAVCKVPNLQGKRLKGAKSSLKAAHCALGKVTRTGKGPGKKAKVVKQSPKAGTLLAAEGKVKITLHARLPKKG